MFEFGAALAVFILSHVIPTRPSVRGRLIAWLGRPAYLAAYSILSVAVLAWLIAAAWRAPYVPVWEPQAWQAAVAVGLVPAGLFLVLAGGLGPNPLSVTFALSGYDPARPGIVAVTRHPVLWGLGLWGLGHVVANGDAVGVILFGTQTLFALFGTALVDRRIRRQLGDEDWRRLAAPTSNLPFAAIAAGRNRYRPDLRQALALALTAAATALLLLADGHAWLFGMDPLVWWR